MSVGGAGNNTVAFGIKAVADLRGIDSTAKALTGLSSKGAQAGQGISRGMDAAARGLDASRARAEALEHSMRGITVAAAAIVGVGVGLFKIGAAFDSVLDSIAVGTGATGKALDALGNDALEVFGSIPTTMETAGLAITELSRRTDQTGKGLQDLAAAEIELARVTESDLNKNIEASAQLFENWGIALEDQVGTLDKLFRASQVTGVSVDKLASELVQYGPILRSMNFGLDESVALLALLDKAGVDSAQVITGLRTAIAKMSAAGVTDLGAALEDVFTQIKNAPTDVSAAAIAIENFGTRAGPAFAENIRAGRLEYGDLMDVIANGESTIRDSAAATNDAAEKFQILRNQVTKAAVPLATQFFDAVNAGIPALVAAANVVGSLGDAFSRLPGPVKSSVAGAIVLAAGLAGITAVGARVVAIGASTVTAWSGVAGAFTKTAVASRQAAAGIVAAGDAAQVANAKTGPLAGNLTKLSGFAARGIQIGVTLVGAELIFDSLNHALEGAQSGPSQNDKIAHKIEHGIGTALNQLPGSIGNWLINDANETLNDQELFNRVGDLGLKINQSFAAGLLTQTSGSVIEGLGGLTVRDIQDRAKQSGRSFTDELVAQAQALKVTTPELEAYVASQKAVTEATEGSTAAAQDEHKTREQIIKDTIDQRREQEGLNRDIQDTLNAQFLASGHFDAWMRPFIENADNAEKAAEDLKRGLDDLIETSLSKIGGLTDVSDLPGMQAGFRDLGDSVVDVTRDMDDLGELDLSPATREALDLSSALSGVERKLLDVDAAIQGNTEDAGMWAGRIDLVTSATGANSQQLSEWLGLLESGQITQEQFNANVASLANGGLPLLDAALASGEITRKEYDAAVAASIFILQRSGGALQDERAELLNNLPALAKLVDAHDDADAALKTQTESQRDLNEALKDPAAQEFINTIEELRARGVSDDVIIEYAVRAASENESVETVARALELLPGEKSIVVSANVNNAINEMERVEGVITGTTADGATIEVFADTSDAAEKFLDLNQTEIAELDGRELIVYVKGDDGKYQEVRREIIEGEIPEKTVKITAVSDIPSVLNPFGSDKGERPPTPDVEQPEPVVFTAEDQVTPVIDEINIDLDTFVTDAATKGTAAGEGFSGGVVTGIGVNSAAIAAAVSGIASAFNLGSSTYNTGFNGGYNFSVGLANGITAGTNAVYNAAFNVAYYAGLGAKAGLGIASPSRVARSIGENFVDSLSGTLRGGANDVQAAADDLARIMQRSMVDPASMPALRGLLTVDQRPAEILAASAGRGGDGPRTTVINQSNRIEFHGVTDTGEIVGHVTTELSRAWDRGATAGVFGS